MKIALFLEYTLKKSYKYVKFPDGFLRARLHEKYIFSDTQQFLSTKNGLSIYVATLIFSKNKTRRFTAQIRKNGGFSDQYFAGRYFINLPIKTGRFATNRPMINTHFASLSKNRRVIRLRLFPKRAFRQAFRQDGQRLACPPSMQRSPESVYTGTAATVRPF